MLRKCVESVLRQTYSNFELLLIDDGSDADHSEQIDAIGKIDHRIHVVHKINEGVSKARNFGIEISKGEYIVFLDSDDTISPNFFQEALKSIQPDVDIAFGKMEWIIGNKVTRSNFSDECSPILQFDFNNYEEKKCFIKKMFYDSDFIAGYRGEVWCKLFRKTLLTDIRFKSGIQIGEDRLFSAECVLKSKKIVIVNSTWYQYYDNPRSAMHDFDFSRVCKYKKYYDALSEFCSQNDCLEILPGCTYYMMLHFLWPMLDFTSLSQLLRFELEFYHHADVSDNLKKINDPDIRISKLTKLFFRMRINYFFILLIRVKTISLIKKR